MSELTPPSAQADAFDRRYEVSHRTSYGYGAAMTDGYTVAHLLPRDTAWQRVERSELLVDPPPDELDEHHDVFGNRIVQFGVHQPHERLDVVASSLVRVEPRPPLGDDATWEDVVAQLDGSMGDAALDLAPMRVASRFVHLGADAPGLEDLAASAFEPGRAVLDVVRDLSDRIHRGFTFDPTSTDWSTPLADVLELRRGVCQDFAHLMIACLRSRGLAARYVSGYIETDPPAGEARLVGADASHAWLAVWTPGHGWVDADPTNDQVPTTRHVTVAWGRDYGDVTPVRGVVIGPSSEQVLEVAVDVVPG